MTQKQMSLFNAPIASVSQGGKVIKYATLYPSRSVTIEEVWKLITSDLDLLKSTTAVRLAADMRAAKTALLPYITACGVFSYRNSSSLVSLSGYVVVDVDHLDSTKEAEEMRERLFNDDYLQPALVFISPSGRGVKAFVPYDTSRTADATQNAITNTLWAMQYVQMTYCPTDREKGVDTSGKDLVRACFLCHDSGALLRTEKSNSSDTILTPSTNE